MKHLVLAFTLILCFRNAGSSADAQQSDPNAQVKQELPGGLPFSPGDPGVEKVRDIWDGNVEYITYRWQGRTFEEKRVWGKPTVQHPNVIAKEKKLQDALQELKLDEKQARQLHLALADSMWQHMPASKRFAGNILAREAQGLKARISNALGTKDPKVIKKVLTIDIGIAYPPMVDYEVRESFDSELGVVEQAISEGSLRQDSQ